MGEQQPPQIIHMNTNLRLPPELHLNTGNVSENFKTWKRQVEIYLRASGTTQLDNETQTATIINCGGEQLLKIYDNFTWDNTEDVNDPTTVFKKIEEYCNPRKNEVAESHKYWSVKLFAPFDQFVTELRMRAKSCNFGQLEDRMIRDKIVFSTTGKMQQLLLRNDELDLRKAIKICQSYEQANKQVQEMNEDKDKQVHKINTKQQKSNHHVNQSSNSTIKKENCHKLMRKFPNYANSVEGNTL